MRCPHNNVKERLDYTGRQIHIKGVKKMMELVKNLFVDEEGQGLVEYALILVLIAIVVIAALTFLGTKVNDTFQNIGNKLNHS
jgi:pilus assembly protein Flp/PilA